MTAQELAEMIERVKARPGRKCNPREHGSERGYQQHMPPVRNIPARKHVRE